MQYLKACLDSVITAMEDQRNAELILLDNGSTDGSYELLLSQFAGTAKVCQIRGVTISALRNHGARVAEGEYLSFVDSDMVVPKDYFSACMDVFASVDTDATGCYYDLPESSNWLEETWDNVNRPPVSTYVPYLCTGNFIIKKAVFEKVGGFNENLATGEDAEVGLRLNACGFKIFASSKVSAVHLGNPKTFGQFFKKHAWHGLGMFGSLKWSWADKPLLATFGHLILTILGALNLFLLPARPGWRITAFLVLSGLAPLATVMYRSVKRGNLYRPLRSILLYYIYLTARVYALFHIIFNKLLRPKGMQRAVGRTGL